jgi:hypothetical protein
MQSQAASPHRRVGQLCVGGKVHHSLTTEARPVKEDRPAETAPHPHGQLAEDAANLHDIVRGAVALGHRHVAVEQADLSRPGAAPAAGREANAALLDYLASLRAEAGVLALLQQRPRHEPQRRNSRQRWADRSSRSGRYGPLQLRLDAAIPLAGAERGIAEGTNALSRG